ncbi:MAG TPA: class I SAM-dependent methyltransferase [Flavisolibacter sp.]|jgi:SAM-dependent methyltransferase
MNLFDKVRRYIAIKFPTERNATRRIVAFWEKGGVDFEYYKSADQENWLAVFWDEKSVFYRLFQYLNTDHLLEIACGTGRHSAKVSAQVKTLYLLDSSRGALDLAKERFIKNNNVQYILNTEGLGIPQNTIEAESLTAVFSYDAMVHFEKEAVESYIRDSYSALGAGGYALFHHSNYDKNPQGRFTDNPGWRNYMTKDLFVSMAIKYGFEIVHSEILSFSSPDSDCITLLKKPASDA